MKDRNLEFFTTFYIFATSATEYLLVIYGPTTHSLKMTKWSLFVTVSIHKFHSWPSGILIFVIPPTGNGLTRLGFSRISVSGARSGDPFAHFHINRISMAVWLVLAAERDVVLRETRYFQGQRESFSQSW
jgi:hypothetical protein